VVAHIFQLWVNLPAKDKLVRAHHQELHAASLPTRHEPGAEIKVFSGSSGSVKSTTTNHVPVTMLQIDLSANITVDLDLPAGYNGFVLMMEGNAEIGTARTTLKAGQLAWLTRSEEASSVRVRGGDMATKALLIAGLPLREPVAAQGPFVMNTDAELRDGLNEYRTRGDQYGL
jgi:redox-sensitive bicupin YhaK (pirin superfamily)